jgi:DNA-binding transcriptional MerR regulator
VTPWTPPDRWLKPREAAHRAGVTTPTIRAWTATRGLTYRRGVRGHREYLESSLEEVLTGAETPQGDS